MTGAAAFACRCCVLVDLNFDLTAPDGDWLSNCSAMEGESRRKKKAEGGKLQARKRQQTFNKQTGGSMATRLKPNAQPTNAAIKCHATSAGSPIQLSFVNRHSSPSCILDS